jgi:hypothetical protein
MGIRSYSRSAPGRGEQEGRHHPNFCSARRSQEALEARGGIEPPIKVLQTFALPLGDRALTPTACFHLRSDPVSRPKMQNPPARMLAVGNLQT